LRLKKSEILFFSFYKGRGRAVGRRGAERPFF
jgi:hypothetical protein